MSNASSVGSTTGSSSMSQQASSFPPLLPTTARGELRRSSHKEPTLSQINHTTVRRVASFTYSPEGSSDKHNKRNASNGGAGTRTNGDGINQANNTSTTTTSRKFTL